MQYFDFKDAQSVKHNLKKMPSKRNVIEKGPLLSIVADATGRNTQTPVTPVANQAQAPAVPAPEVPVEEPTGRLTGPGVKAARSPAQPQMTAEVLGRERR